MIRIITTVVLAASVSLSFGQTEQIKNKNGVDIMPVAGEFGLGFNAVPVFNYVGNVFGFTGNNTEMGSDKFVDYFSMNTIFGKYMLTESTAIRGHFRLGQYNGSYQNDIFNDAANNPDSLVMDTYKSKNSIFNLGVGYEFRRGKTRLRGIYGGELMYQYQSGLSQNFTYGNGFGNGNPAPTSTEWLENGQVDSELALGERITTLNNGNFHGLGIRAFAGVEYYLAPKICLGGEFGWGFMGGFSNETTTATEFWNPTADGTGAVQTNEFVGSRSRTFTADTDNFGGSLYFMFYF